MTDDDLSLNGSDDFFPSIICQIFNKDNENDNSYENPLTINTFIDNNNLNSFNSMAQKINLDYESNFDSESPDNVYLIKNDKLLIFMDENNQNILSTKGQSKTDNIKDLGLKPLQSNKKKIYKITKDFKGKGRIKKNTNFVGKHNKFAEDNIIRKIKGRFLEYCRLYINYSYKKYFLNNTQTNKKYHNLLQKIDSKIVKQIKKERNIEWFDTKLYKIFSQNVSEKCSQYKEDYNKKQIKLLYDKNEVTDVIQILNMPVREMYENFILNKKREGFKTLENDLEEIKKKMIEENEDNIEEYLNKYEYIAQNLESIFMKKNPRKNNKKHLIF